jgi:hypothetical protein
MLNRCPSSGNTLMIHQPQAWFPFRRLGGWGMACRTQGVCPGSAAVILHPVVLSTVSFLKRTGHNLRDGRGFGYRTISLSRKKITKRHHSLNWDERSILSNQDSWHVKVKYDEYKVVPKRRMHV